MRLENMRLLGEKIVHPYTKTMRRFSKHNDIFKAIDDSMDEVLTRYKGQDTRLFNDILVDTYKTYVTGSSNVIFRKRYDMRATKCKIISKYTDNELHNCNSICRIMYKKQMKLFCVLLLKKLVNIAREEIRQSLVSMIVRRLSDEHISRDDLNGAKIGYFTDSCLVDMNHLIRVRINTLYTYIKMQFIPLSKVRKDDPQVTILRIDDILESIVALNFDTDSNHFIHYFKTRIDFFKELEYYLVTRSGKIVSLTYDYIDGTRRHNIRSLRTIDGEEIVHKFVYYVDEPLSLVFKPGDKMHFLKMVIFGKNLMTQIHDYNPSIFDNNQYGLLKMKVFDYVEKVNNQDVTSLHFILDDPIIYGDSSLIEHPTMEHMSHWLYNSDVVYLGDIYKFCAELRYYFDCQITFNKMIDDASKVLIPVK